MRQKINPQLLSLAQDYAKDKNHPIIRQLYQHSYGLVMEMLSPVNRHFNNVCIHGNYPEYMLPHMKHHLSQKHSLTSHSFIPSPLPNVEFCGGQFVKKSEQYDLIITCLEGHHGNFDANIKGYLESLQPDGALIGCTYAENTMKELHWAYLMAQNERCGGISPKVYGFPSIGAIGNVMHASKLQIPTIMVKDAEVEVESVVDILTILQLTGESGYLQGRRKAVFPDLLLAMSALYDSQFGQPGKVKFSLEFATFIGWKYHQSQAQPMKRTQLVNKTFIDELKQYDPDLQQFTIEQEDDDPNSHKK